MTNANLGSLRYWMLGWGQRSKVHGDARWMTDKEAARVFSGKHRDGLTLSPERRLSEADACKNLVLVAPTGMGKTSRYIIPSVLNASGSVVITDPSGEIYQATSGHLQARGFRIKVFRPDTPQESLSFNPLRYFRASQELQYLANALARNGNAGDGSDRFWMTGAANILYLGMRALTRVEDARYRNLANLRWLLSHYGRQGEAGMNGFMGKYLDAVDFADYRGFVSQDRPVAAGMLSSARTALDLWSNRAVCRLTAADEMDIGRIRAENTAVYLIAPEDEMDFYGPVMNLFYLVCFRHCLRDWSPEQGGNAEKLAVYFFLDEFAQLGRIERFANIITTLRKRRCSVSIVLQNLAQLNTLYGREEAESIFAGGCANKLFFPGLDVKTCRHVEEALGQRTDYDTTLGGVSDGARTVGVPLLRAEEMRMLEPDQGVLVSGQYRPARLTMPAYFRIPRWRAWTEQPPAPVRGRSEAVRYFPVRELADDASRQDSEHRHGNGSRGERTAARASWEAEVERMAAGLESAGHRAEAAEREA